MVSKFCQSQDLSEPSILLNFMVFWTCSASLGWSFTLTLKHSLEFEFSQSLSWKCRWRNILWSLCTFGQASVISSVLSHLNKNLKQRTLKPSARHSSWTDRVIALGSQTDLVIALRSVLQLRVTAQFSLEKSKKTHPQGVRACQPKVVKRERET